MRTSRLTDLQVIRARNYNESLLPPEADDDSEAFLSELIGEEAEEETDETLEYMVDLLEAREIDADDFRQQLRSVGYDDETIASAIAEVQHYHQQGCGEPSNG